MNIRTVILGILVFAILISAVACTPAAVTPVEVETPTEVSRTDSSAPASKEESKPVPTVSKEEPASSRREEQPVSSEPPAPPQPTGVRFIEQPGYWTADEDTYEQSSIWSEVKLLETYKDFTAWANSGRLVLDPATKKGLKKLDKELFKKWSVFVIKHKEHSYQYDMTVTGISVQDGVMTLNMQLNRTHLTRKSELFIYYYTLVEKQSLSPQAFRVVIQHGDYVKPNQTTTVTYPNITNGSLLMYETEKVKRQKDKPTDLAGYLCTSYSSLGEYWRELAAMDPDSYDAYVQKNLWAYGREVFDDYHLIMLAVAPSEYHHTVAVTSYTVEDDCLYVYLSSSVDKDKKKHHPGRVYCLWLDEKVVGYRDTKLVITRQELSNGKTTVTEYEKGCRRDFATADETLSYITYS